MEIWSQTKHISLLLLHIASGVEENKDTANEIASFLMDHNVDINFEDRGKTPMIKAMEQNNTDLVQDILTRG